MSSDATTYTIQGLLGASSTDGADDSARQSCGDGIANKSGEKSDPSAARPTDVHTVENLADELLFKQVQEGDSAALGILFRRYARMVRTVAQRILRDASEADDLLQEVFLFAFRKAALFNSARGSIRSWLVQVTYHRAIDRRRYLASRHFYTSVELDDSVLGGREDAAMLLENSIEGTVGKETLRRINESLSDDQSRVIRLYFFEGYTLEEIAVDLGQALGNIRNHYYRALEKMRRHIFASKAEQVERLERE